MRRNAYWVKYRAYASGEVKGIDIIASNKVEAWDTAVYKAIPKVEGEMPYSAWVYSVTYQNGNYKTFNTFEGMPY